MTTAEKYKKYTIPMFGDRQFEVVSGKGCTITDSDGKKYLDFGAGIAVNSLGHANKRWADAVARQANTLAHCSNLYLTKQHADLAEKLVGLIGKGKVFFCNSGTEANEGAIKFARAHTKRPRILSLSSGYHGLSYGSLSLTVSPHFQDGYGPFLPGAMKVPYNDLEALEAELKKMDVAAFIFEPVQGKGVNIPSDDYFPKAQELCRKYGTLFVADEVQTGLGRTGKMFAFRHWNLDPDIVTLAKALSGGYVPCAAFVTTREIHQSSFSSLDRCVVHSTTFGRNNLAMVCGLAAIHVLENEGLVENCAKMGDLLLQKLNALKEKHSYIKEVRGKGLMIAIEFKEPNGFGQKLAWKGLKVANDALFTQMIVTSLLDKHRILTQVASHGLDAIKILPPFVIGETEVDRFVNALDDVLTNATNVTGPLWKFGTRLLSAAMANKKNK